jgi:hypothetical protein
MTHDDDNTKLGGVNVDLSSYAIYDQTSNSCGRLDYIPQIRTARA